MAGICKWCGFSGTNDAMMQHAGECPMLDFEDFKEEIERAPGSENDCGGPQHCKNREFDGKNAECQECLENANRALMELEGWDKLSDETW